MRGVDAAVRQITNRLQHSALTLDGLEQRNVGGSEGVLATSLAESLGNHIVVCFQKYHFAIDALVSNSGLDIGKAIEGGTQITCIDDRRHPLRSWLGGGQFGGKCLQQPQRQVVDALVAEVLENIQGDALTRPRQPADYDELHGPAIGLLWKAC